MDKNKEEMEFFDRAADLETFAHQIRFAPKKPQYTVGCVDVGKSSLHQVALPVFGVPTLHLDMQSVDNPPKNGQELAALFAHIHQQRRSSCPQSGETFL
eukprot:TRINITY_DN1554_c0_g1_i1.p1 TRINITY_DN1554_c0_g1~~TRINITY_DN1554_c0_g1_i1.p1  ORF type:complete len:99 (+),score=13.50 TRINITY_DN1554_c0_g1_i1:230-526(+)